MATESAPWQIKSMPIGTREKAVRYAKMRGETMAEWMARAVDTQASIEDGDRVLPPGEPEQTHHSRPMSGVNLETVAVVLQAMAAAQASGLPVSKTAVRETVGLIREQMRAARGLPVSQTRPRIGQTISHDDDISDLGPAREASGPGNESPVMVASDESET